MMKLPEGMQADLHIYLVSEFDGCEVEVVVSLRGFPGIPAIGPEMDLAALVKTLSLDIGPLDLAKTRLMTPAEIADYRRKQADEDLYEGEE